ncbi:hypothetical protein [Burkholderia cepacia]|uniref:hypothetical protein n=1 Tax=Burkholderia cepacia TaxID=292 RepID=UPI001CF4948C|nr:hypothetical protein [Burkholderia cepacia]MCA8350742.1 hypothetical protein [Burkholderia cepacia]
MIVEIIDRDDGHEAVVEGSNVYGWDSLTQLNILLALDKELDGRPSAVEELATCRSLEEIYTVLVAANLAAAPTGTNPLLCER